jgi:predicted naringenin-chalcone synthase
MELMDLPNQIFRTSLNFMGCYAAIHALNIADSICKTEKEAKVMVVCTELCTLHFQRESTADNISSSLLFGDGSAAALVTSDDHPAKGIRLEGFYSEVMKKGRKDMAWELSSTGFQMTLSSYVPDLIEEDFSTLVNRALQKFNLPLSDITHWCIHPGGRKILEAIQTSLRLPPNSLSQSYEVLRNFGNMSSPTILFVLDRIAKSLLSDGSNRIFVAAFGPGLTIETFVARA